MKQLRVLVVIGSLLGIVMLHGYSLQLQPKEVRIADLKGHEGEMVRTSGYVIEYYSRSGDTRFRLKDGNASVPVFMNGDRDIGVNVGDRIELTGEVITYQGGYALSGSDPISVSVLEEWDGSILTIPGLSADPWSFCGRNVNLSCRIGLSLSDRDGYGYAVVEDSYLVNYSLPVLVYGNPVQRLYAGAVVFANARFEYLRTSLGFGLIMDSEEHHFWLAWNGTGSRPED